MEIKTEKPLKQKRIAKPKAKKLTVAELKRRIVPGSKLIMTEFNGQPVNKVRVVDKVSGTYAMFRGDGIEEGKVSYLTWPKASELTEIDGGFKLNNKFSTLVYKWDINEPEVKQEIA